MSDHCSVCSDRNINKEGVDLAEKEVIPFFKKELLQLRYPTHPFPPRFENLISSLLAYGQALAFDRVHGRTGVKFFTKNKWLLKHSDAMRLKFDLQPVDESELQGPLKEVCEFNVSK
jgi:hypothetical protein